MKTNHITRQRRDPRSQQHAEYNTSQRLDISKGVVKMADQKLFNKRAYVGVAALALAAGLSCAAPATAQSTATPPLGAAAPTDGADSKDDSDSTAIVVTGSRVDRKGFQAPTPVTVLGADDIRLGARANIALLLNDQPAFRGTTTPTTTPANTNSGTSIVDLRGLGTRRTLTLLNSRRFIGSFDLNSVPIGLIKRVEVVTGGASADWGSGAVAGVVNLILDDELKGVTLTADTGISTRGDAGRYNVNATFGTGFADDRGHISLAGGYFKDNGAFDRNSGTRPNLDSTLFTGPTGVVTLQNDVNLITSTPGGYARTGPFAGRTFNPDGTLGSPTLGAISNATQTIGGSNRNVTDYYAVSSPYERYNAYGRATYEFSRAAKLWVDVNFNRVTSKFGFFPENVAVTIQRDNAYLSPALRTQLGTATGFTLGRLLDDVGPDNYFSFAYVRDSLDIGFGIDGELGGSWKYSIYFDHGRFVSDETPTNQRITANFNNAVDAVISPTTGQPICRIALTVPSTTCQPINLLGSRNISAAGVAYAFGDARQRLVNELDAGGVSLRGNLFSTWAGPVSVAAGFEARREGTRTTFIDSISPTRAFSLDNRFPLDGAFDVKEGFAEAVVPIINAEGSIVVELNGAGRYSDYSTSGGIWSWKFGGTARLFDDLRLRSVYSRDIRSPAISELFAIQSINIPTVIDPFRNNQAVLVTRFTGGNPNLRPEIASTLSFGGSYAPHYVPGLNISVDYYDIDIKDVIGTISAQDAINRCFAGFQPACDTIVRDSTGTITTLFGTQVNLAQYRTSGIDFDLAYRLPLSTLGGGSSNALRFRLLATYVDRLIINDGVNTFNRAGDVGDNAGFTTPQWKATGSIGYESPSFLADMRIRYVGGGRFNSVQPIVNNMVDSRTYFDFNVQVNVSKQFSLFGAVTNAFDREPPFVTFTSAIYDVIGRYVSGGVKLRF